MAETYRVAVAGSTQRGKYGHGLDTAWKEVAATEIVAVSDDDEGGRAIAANRLGVTQTFADYREMIANVKPDILAVCPRWADQHRDMIVAAAERGIHVYTEKPFCRTLAEADEIVELCERTHAKVAIAHPTRYSPKIDAIKKLIADGQLGRVLEYRGRGKEDHRGGAEDLWVLGSHLFDTVLNLAGLPKWCFARVTKGGRLVTKADVYDGNEGLGPLAGDGIDAMFGLPDGSTFYFASHARQANGPSRYALQLKGSKGELELLEGVMPSATFLADPAWSPGRTGATWEPITSAGPGKEEPLTAKRYADRHTLAIEDLLSTIGTDRQPKCNAYVGRQIVEMIMSIFESHRVGGPVELPREDRGHPLAKL